MVRCLLCSLSSVAPTSKHYFCRSSFITTTLKIEHLLSLLGLIHVFFCKGAQGKRKSNLGKIMAVDWTNLQSHLKRTSQIFYCCFSQIATAWGFLLVWEGVWGTQGVHHRRSKGKTSFTLRQSFNAVPCSSFNAKMQSSSNKNERSMWMFLAGTIFYSLQSLLLICFWEVMGCGGLLLSSLLTLKRSRLVTQCPMKRPNENTLDCSFSRWT